MTTLNLSPRAALTAASVLFVSATVWAARAPQVPAAAMPDATPAAIEFFETHVRPVLAESCYHCHTDDEKGGLRVDSRAALIAGGESGPAIVPGDPDASLLMKAIRHQAGAAKMPRSDPKLPDTQIAALAEWIRTGAVWPAAAGAMAAMPRGPIEKVITDEHRAFWSFRPLATAEVPAVARQDWATTDIDRFILARLERDGLSPVAAADRRTLIRRATLGLTGLPATFEEIEAFAHDDSPDAWATVIDRLLASPAYGEMWGRHWLDVARYGEDDPRSLDPRRRGYAPYPNAYLYRDWVIKVFNDDLPYDQFVKAQIAGDLLDQSARARTLPALGFLGLGPWYYDNGSVEITRADERHDRVDVVSRGFLGLTVACARCHDHKYDAIQAKDYYAMAGVFRNTVYHEYPLVPKALAEEQKRAEKRLEHKEDLLGEFLRTESRLLAETHAFSASKYMQAAWKVTGEPKKEQVRVAGEEKLDHELFERWIQFLAKPPTFYPYVKAWQAMIAVGGTAAEAKTLADAFQTLLLDVMFEQKEIEEENKIITAQALPGTKPKKPAKLPHEFVTNDDFCPGCALELKSMESEKMLFFTDVFRRDLGEGFDPMDLEYIKPGLLAFRGWSLERQLSADRRAHIAALRADIKEAEAALTPRFAYVHGVREDETPVNLRLALRGDPMKLGEEVPRRFVSVLSSSDPAPVAAGSGRLELAEAIAAHPLTARVIVNRIWATHFGTGIVSTPSNFGENGERPTHPELLEHLASRFVAEGQSIKQLHRAIMLSAVYQLSAADAPVNAAKDAGNRLHWRAKRVRMTAEQIRDAVLFVSGTLDRTMGGPSTDLSPAFERRTVYGKVSRYRLDPFLQLFDHPAPTISAEQRFTTHVPLQRLFFMNSDFMQEQGERLARRVAGEPDVRARIRKAYRLVFGRGPSDAELEAGAAYLLAEPMRTYEERKAEAQTASARPGVEAPKAAAAGAADTMPPMENPGMMAGVLPGAAKAAETTRKPLPVTPLGRYMKVLLSSNEFLFIE